MRALSTKDIIKKIITPPISPSSPAAGLAAAFVMQSTPSSIRSSCGVTPPPHHSNPRASSPKSSSKSSARKAVDMGVFNADFIVAKKAGRDGASYLIRLSQASAPILPHFNLRATHSHSRWSGYGSESDSWETERNVSQVCCQQCGLKLYY
jgi:hypothetical protein